MKNSSKTWAEVTTPNKYKTTESDWPDLNIQSKNHIQGKEDVIVSAEDNSSDQINTLTNAMERISTKDTEQENQETTCHKSRDEIKAERKLRRKAKQIEKEERHLQEKLAQIREPKTQKVKLVDKVVMETYLLNQQKSSNRNRQSKSKNHSAVKVNLLDLINAEVVKKIDKPLIQNKKTIKLTSITQRHKGKKREIQRKKYVSKLKKSILLSRSIRKQIRSNEGNVVPEQASVDLAAAEPNDKGSFVNDQNETTSCDKSPEIVQLPGVKFSRKFRP